MNLTDIVSQWTQTRAVWNKGQHGVVSAIAHMEAALPFALRSVDIDNGSELRARVEIKLRTLWKIVRDAQTQDEEGELAENQQEEGSAPVLELSSPPLRSRYARSALRARQLQNDMHSKA